MGRPGVFCLFCLHLLKKDKRLFFHIPRSLAAGPSSAGAKQNGGCALREALFWLVFPVVQDMDNFEQGAAVPWDLGHRCRKLYPWMLALVL